MSNDSAVINYAEAKHQLIKMKNDFEKRNRISPEEKVNQNLLILDHLFNLDDEFQDDNNCHPENFFGWGHAISCLKPLYRKNDKILPYINQNQFYNILRSSETSYYTPDYLIHYLWLIAQKLGVNAGKAIDPAAGIGLMSYYCPESMKPRFNFTLIEQEELSSRVSQVISPEAKILNQPFEEFEALPEYDLVITNVPFSKNNPIDIKYIEEHNYNTHEYFVRKSIDLLSSNGIFIGITSSYLSNKSNNSARKRILENAKLLGIIELPYNTFAHDRVNAQTQILILQKRSSKLILRDDLDANLSLNGAELDWLNSNLPTCEEIENKLPNLPFDIQAKINAYSINHPEMLPGKYRKSVDRYGEDQIILEEDDDEEQYFFQLIHILSSLPDSIYNPNNRINTTSEEVDNPNRQLIEGQVEDYQLDNFLIYEETSNKFMTLKTVYNKKYWEEIQILNNADQNNTKIFINLRDILIMLIEAESIDDEESMTLYRDILNQGYDKYFSKNPIFTYKWPEVVQDDPWYGRFIGLEKADFVSKTATKADIFFKRLTQTDHTLVDHEYTIDEALALAVANLGQVDFGYISQLVKNPNIREIENYLLDSNKIFLTHTGEYEIAEVYLSGNLYEKIKLAEDAGLEDNVIALKKALPKRKLFEEIILNMGANYIEFDIIQRYFYDHLGYRRERCALIFDQTLGVWAINAKDEKAFNNNVNGKLSKYNFQSAQTSEIKIVEAALNNQVLRSRTKNAQGKYVINIEETMLIAEKTEELKNNFLNWLQTNPELKDRITERYNQIHNSYVAPDFSKMEINFRDINININLYENQKKAAYRGIIEGRSMIVQPVGNGKTNIMGIIAHEWRKKGIAKRPLIVTRNNSLYDVVNALTNLYPQDKVLAITRSDVKDIKSIVGLVLNNDWDIIVINHELFHSLSLSPEEIECQILAQKELLVKYADENAENYNENRISKEYAKRLNKIEQDLQEVRLKLESNAEKSKLYFEYLQIDAIIYDEIHNAKNSGDSAYGMENSIALPRSFRSIDLLSKISWLERYRQQKYRGKLGEEKLCFCGATGTILSNHVLELYVMQKMVLRKELEAAGLHNINNWVKTFIGFDTQWEPSVLGDGFREKTRPYYINAKDLRALNNIAFDIYDVSPEIKLPVAKTKIVECYFDESQETFIEETLFRAQNLDLTSKTKNIKGNENFEPFLQNGITLPENSVLNLLHKKDSAALWNPEIDDNMLAVINDAKLICLNPKLYNPKIRNHYLQKIGEDSAYAGLGDILINENSSKVENLVQNVMHEYRASQKILGTQLIFCDMGVNEINNFEFFKYIKSRLVAAGIKESEIALSKEITNDLHRANFNQRMNSGKYRVAIGSTEKFGEAINVQNLMCAIHNLDIPYRPKDYIQRIGRGVRKNNINDSVSVYFYISAGREDRKIKGSIESYIYWLNEVKKENLHNFIYGKDDDCESVIDVNGVDQISYAEMSAIANGSPLVKEKLQAESKLKKLLIMRRAKMRELGDIKSQIASNQEEIQILNNRLKMRQANINSRDKSYDPEIEKDYWFLLTDLKLEKKEQPEYLENNDKILNFIRSLKKDQLKLKFKFRGFTINYEKTNKFDITWSLSSYNFSHYYEIENYIDSLLDTAIEEKIEQLKNNLSINIKNLENIYAKQSQESQYESEIQEVTDRLNRILAQIEEQNAVTEGEAA